MTTHKFHNGYDRRLPPPSARKGRVLPKIAKKKKEAKEDLCKPSKSVGLCEEKELKKKKSDYPKLIREYEKAKKNGSVSKWAKDNEIKNPKQRVWAWRQSIFKQARKESEQE